MFLSRSPCFGIVARKTRESEERRWRAYKISKTDEDAATLLGMNLLTFKSWRRSRGYPEKLVKLKLKSKKKEMDTIRRMLSEGASFEVIATDMNKRQIGNKESVKTPASVAWNALRLGIISKEELDKWYETNRRLKRAAREAGRAGFRSAVLERDGGKCAVCGSQEKLEVDHIIELSRGGLNDPSNGVTLCRACHRLKTHPRAEASWHIFVQRYTRVLTPLGFKVKYGTCSEHRNWWHHYIFAEKAAAAPEGTLDCP